MTLSCTWLLLMVCELQHLQGGPKSLAHFCVRFITLGDIN